MKRPKPIIILRAEDAHSVVYHQTRSLKTVSNRLSKIKKKLGLEVLTIETFAEYVGVDYEDFLMTLWEKTKNKPERFGSDLDLVRSFLRIS